MTDEDFQRARPLAQNVRDRLIRVDLDASFVDEPQGPVEAGESGLGLLVGTTRSLCDSERSGGYRAMAGVREKGESELEEGSQAFRGSQGLGEKIVVTQRAGRRRRRRS